jgi:DNA primase
VRITHPDRVMFAAQGVTKRALIEPEHPTLSVARQ